MRRAIVRWVDALITAKLAARPWWGDQ